MRSKYLAVIVAYSLLFGIASAQEYSIRANRGLNLRAAPSRNADIADTVGTGAILQVVGRFNRWLKINHNGREVWLADWVNYSRVDSGEPSGSPQPTAPAGQPVDNCCFVDRQCQSDQEWTDGYWAYQNGQCAAPAQPQPATPAQLVASTPETVDNCCYIDRHCQSEHDWIVGWHAFRHGHCVAPARPSASAPSRPQIEGSARFVRLIARSLNLLRDKAPEWYTYVNGATDTIAEIPNSQPEGGGCSATALQPARRVELETCTLSNPGFSNPILMAGTLVHEACHIHTWEAGIVYPYGIAQEELECEKPMRAVYKLLNPNGWRAWVSTADESRRILLWLCHNRGYEDGCQMAELVHLYYD